MKGGTNDDFLMLKSEYIGPGLFTGGIVTISGLATVNGQMTGSAVPGCHLLINNVFEAGTWRPYTIFGQSYENAPDWMRLSMSLMSDIVMATRWYGQQGS